MNLAEMVEQLTLEDAIKLYVTKGMCCVCADGKLKHFELR